MIQTAVISKNSTETIITEVRKKMIRDHGDKILEKTDQFDLEKYNELATIISSVTRQVIKREDQEIENAVIAQLIGLGAIDIFLADPEVEEIFVNSPWEVLITKNGITRPTDVKFQNSNEVLNYIYRIVHRCNRRINFTSPLEDARLPDGSRVNIVIPPSSKYPIITICRWPTKIFTTEELIQMQTISLEMSQFFKTMIEGRANFIVCGAGGCGKTSFLRWLSTFIPEYERPITIEDTYELQLNHPRLIALEASEKASIYDLTINALRMRATRIWIGEIRGKEALPWLDASGTAHEGSGTSIHVNKGKVTVLQRLIRAMAQDKLIPTQELIQMICENLDLIIFLKKYPEIGHRVVQVTQIENDLGKPKFIDIFAYNRLKNIHQKVGKISPELREKICDNISTELGPVPGMEEWE